MVDSNMAFLAPAVSGAAVAKLAHKSAKDEGGGEGGFAEVLAKSSERVSGQSGAPEEHEAAAGPAGKSARDDDKAGITPENIANGADVAMMIALATADGTMLGNALGAATTAAMAATNTLLPQVPDDRAAGQADGQVASVGIKDAAPDLRSALAPPVSSSGDKTEITPDAATATAQAVRTTLPDHGQGQGMRSARAGASAGAADAAPAGDTTVDAEQAADNDPSAVRSLSTRVLAAGNRDASGRVATARADSHPTQPTLPATRGDGTETPAPVDQAHKSVAPAVSSAPSASAPPGVSPQAPAAQPESSTAMASVVGAAAQSVNAHAGNATPPVILVATHVENPGWSKDFGQHVIRLAVTGQPAAEIHLNPPDLGPIRVSIEMKGQDATLQFVAAHPQTREAIEGCLPRLRELFAGGNITLAGADVASQSFSDQAFGSSGQRFPQPSAAALTGRSSSALRIEDSATVVAVTSRSSTSRSRVDLFA